MPTAIVLGASADPSRFSHRAVIAFQRAGFHTVPVHPRETTVAGLPCVPSLEQVPRHPDVISVYLSPPRWAGLVTAIVAAQPGEVWLNPGTEDSDLEAALVGQGIRVRRLCSLIELDRDPV